ncbi:MAG: leucine--tRNA ligase, partial [Planctomycetota bacterium]
HPEGYTATDIVCRFARMRGKSVMHPMGFDAFGLPAEEHAIRTGTHPREQTQTNIDNFRRQLKMLGFSYDWQRELATIDTDYVRWTQRIFLLMYETWFDPAQQKGRPISELPIPADVEAAGEEAVRQYVDDHRLAYQSEAPVNWCPALGTVLANEEVVNGLSERGNHPVERRPLRQWMLRITAYADRLESGLQELDWPNSIKLLQQNWIGRSTGAEADFFIGPDEQFSSWQTERSKQGFPRTAGPDVLRIYTTRPDTLFGATYMVIAPEHPLVAQLTVAAREAEVTAYCEEARAKSELERTELSKGKTGVFTGSYARNPVNGAEVPIWVADYVLATYGTGAIMAVPAHDERDFEFATQFELPIVPVVDPGGDDPARDEVLAGNVCSAQPGVAVNSGKYDGLATAEFKTQIGNDLKAAGVGRPAVNYKLRDWLFSRQRFWGEPFPILHEVDAQGERTGRTIAVGVNELPVDLPVLEDFKPHGRPEPPLDKAPEEWLFQEIDGRRYKRETNTMPQWAGSCWYYLRFLDPKNDTAIVDPEIERAWMPVDLYVGGAEHAVLHLLYARFWHHVLHDRGFVSSPEPFRKLVNQGMILGEVEMTGYQDAAGNWVSAEQAKGDGFNPVKVDPQDVEKKGDQFVLKTDATIRLDSRAHKMSKSRGNVVNPDVVVQEYGADALRLYEMFMGPLEATKPWSMDGVNGVYGFLGRVWRLMVSEQAESIELHPAVQEIEPTEEQLRVQHKTLAAVTADIESMSFNTAISRMMEFVNFFTRESQRPKSCMESLVLMLAPFAPHLAEELWSLLGHNETLAYAPWPTLLEQYLVESTLEIPVQINGKLKDKVTVAADANKDQVLTAAREAEKIQPLLEGKQIVKEVVVPGRLVNFVVK